MTRTGPKSTVVGSETFVDEVTKIALDNKVPSLNALQEQVTAAGKSVADALTDLIAKGEHSTKLIKTSKVKQPTLDQV